jgi:hypothetical protein
MAIVPDEYQQRRVLRRLAKESPGLVEVSLFAEIDTPEGHRALFYLAEKGLVEPGQISDRPGRSREMLEARITAKGLDWLESGGDSREVPNQATVADTEALRHFLLQSLNVPSLSERTRMAGKKRLLDLSTEELKALHLKLLQALAERPDIIVEVLLSERNASDL